MYLLVYPLFQFTSSFYEPFVWQIYYLEVNQIFDTISGQAGNYDLLFILFPVLHIRYQRQKSCSIRIIQQSIA